jgi:predicted metal-dependent peptidase
VTDSTLAEKSKAKTVTDPARNAKAVEALITARVGLLLRAPFFGNLATRMTLINADEWCPTAATDGRRFYYNSEFVLSLPLRQLEFLFGHEVLHAVYDHVGRRADRDPKIFNIAADYCVNADLLDQRIGDRIVSVPILYSPKYKGWSAEEVYDDLLENADKQQIDDLLKQLLDEHLDGEGDSDGDANGNDKGNSNGKGRPKLSDEERREIRDELKEAMLNAAKSSDAGQLPAGVKRLINDLTRPVINWRDLIEQQIQSTIKNDFTWTRPSRKGWHTDAIMPGTVPGTQIDVCVAIDTSGSIGEEDIKAFLGEIEGIMQQYDEYNIRVWSFDTSVYNDQMFTSDNMQDISEYQPMGGGGTDFVVNWTYMKENGIEPKKFIMFTDGYPWDSWGDPDYCDTVFIIKGGANVHPPFGIWAHYEEEASKR